MIFRRDQFERPYRDVAAQAVAARDLPIELTETRIKIGTARYRSTLAERWVVKHGGRLDHHHRRRRREIMRDELFQQILGELGEFVFELELHPCGKKSGSFQQPTDQRIDAVLQNATQALRNSRIFLGELARMLVEQPKFGVVEIEKFLVHARSQSIDDNFSGLDNVGDEFDGNVHRMAHQFATDDEAYLELDGIDFRVPCDAQRIGRNSRLIVDNGGPDLLWDLVHAVFVDGANSDVGNPEIQNRFTDMGRVLHVDGRVQCNRVQKSIQVTRYFAAEHALGDDLPGAQPAAGNDAVARLIALIDDPFGVLGLMGSPENMHQRRAETRVPIRIVHTTSVSGGRPFRTGTCRKQWGSVFPKDSA